MRRRKAGLPVESKFKEILARINKALAALEPLFRAGSFGSFPEVRGDFVVEEKTFQLKLDISNWKESGWKTRPPKCLWAKPVQAETGFFVWGVCNQLEFVVVEITAQPRVRACCSSSDPIISCEHPRDEIYYLQANSTWRSVGLEDLLYLYEVTAGQILGLLKDSAWAWMEARKRLYEEAVRANEALQAP